MGAFNDFMIVVLLLLEVAVLFYLESKTWDTIYTPLNFLMLPYLAVILITILISEIGMGFSEFYYPSIFLWIVGLAVFSIPSFAIGYAINRKGIVLNASNRELNQGMTWLFVALSIILILLFAWHTKSMATVSEESIGSDAFGEEFGGGGIWGHLRQITIPLMMLSIYYLDRQHRWLWVFIISFIIINLLNQVKGWVIIPVLSGLCMRLYTGKSGLSSKLLLYVLLACFLFFGLSYALSLMLALNRGVSNEFVDFVLNNFLHYLTSGTLGLSVDAMNGFPDSSGNFGILIAQFVNLTNKLFGEDMISPINPLFYFTGFSLTNVRTFFGTIYINSDCMSFFLLVLFMSTMMYFLMLALMKFRNEFVCMAYFFFCGLLFMGWFDWYFATLVLVEVTVIIAFLHVGSRFFSKI